MERFLERMEEVVSQIDQIEKNTIELRSLQKKILMATNKDKASEGRMNDLMEQNKTLSKKARRVLKEEQEKCEKAEEEQNQESPG